MSRYRVRVSLSRTGTHRLVLATTEVDAYTPSEAAVRAAAGFQECIRVNIWDMTVTRVDPDTRDTVTSLWRYNPVNRSVWQ